MESMQFFQEIYYHLIDTTLYQKNIKIKQKTSLRIRLLVSWFELKSSIQFGILIFYSTNVLILCHLKSICKSRLSMLFVTLLFSL